jgi:ferric-dicitrate binding protein FerR (iron transport regulator)
MRRKLISILISLSGLMLWASSARAEVPVGTVAGVRGLVTDHGRVLRPGEMVQVGDTIDTPDGSRLKLQMADRSVISMAPGSSMQIINYNLDGAGRYVKLSLARGLLRVLVTAARGPSTFDVRTAAGTASVRSRSADWFVRVQSGGVQVGVLDGTVDLSGAATRQLVSIPSHWGTRSEIGLKVMPPRRWGKSDFSPLIDLTECCQLAQPKVAQPSE